jgi:hypothetical protein
MHWETEWNFKLGRFEVLGQVAPEEMNPADDFDNPADVEAIQSGEIDWFQVRVVVTKDGHEIGSDYLGGCAYKSVQDFFKEHRDRDPMNRNCSIMRKARGDNVVICHYFPDMVHQAIQDARKTLA